MGDMSKCPHGGHVGYCDDCSPGWEMDLIKADAADKIYQRGVEKGLEQRSLELDIAHQRIVELTDKVEQYENQRAAAYMVSEAMCDDRLSFRKAPNALRNVPLYKNEVK